MPVLPIQSVVILGAGHVAWHFAHHLQSAGIEVRQIYNRTQRKAESLAGEIGATAAHTPESIDRTADLYLMAISDDALENVADELRLNNQLLVHMAGSVSLDILSGKARQWGVLYPLMSFTRGQSLDLGEVPFFIEAGDSESLERLAELAGKLSRRVYQMDSQHRARLHLAAVIASNFSNHMLTLAEKILHEDHLSVDLLGPIMTETLKKAMNISPAKAQSGPAIRGNSAVIGRHLAMLNDDRITQELYRIISESIRQTR